MTTDLKKLAEVKTFTWSSGGMKSGFHWYSEPREYVLYSDHRTAITTLLQEVETLRGKLTNQRNVSEHPQECPITRRPFFMVIEHPELGDVATYGGPFDSYTIPAVDEDGDLRCERYDHDRGDWIEGGEPTGYWLATEQQEALARHEEAAPQEKRPCTCHPSDNPPQPCPEKYALSECRAAAAPQDLARLYDEGYRGLDGDPSISEDSRHRHALKYVVAMSSPRETKP